MPGVAVPVTSGSPAGAHPWETAAGTTAGASAGTVAGLLAPAAMGPNRVTPTSPPAMTEPEIAAARARFFVAFKTLPPWVECSECGEWRNNQPHHAAGALDPGW